MASMGWLVPEGGLGEREVTVDGRRMRVPAFVRSEMTEFSIVAIGSNRQAYVQERALRPQAAEQRAAPAGAPNMRADAGPSASEPSPDASALEPTGAEAAADAERDAPVTDDAPVVPAPVAEAVLARVTTEALQRRQQVEHELGQRVVDTLTGRG